MKRFLALLLCLGLLGCVSVKSGVVQKDNFPTQNLKIVMNYSREQVLDAFLLAVKNQSNLSGPFFEKKIGLLSIIFEGDNPTTVRIVQMGIGEDCKQSILNEVHRLLEAQKTE